MHKDLMNFIETNQLKQDGKFYYGSYNGYQAFMKYDMFSMPTMVNGFCSNFKDKKMELQTWFETQRQALKLSRYQIEDYYLTFSVVEFTMKGAIKNVQNAFMAISEKLHELGVLGEEYCPICNQLFTFNDLIHIDGIPMMVDTTCKETLEKAEAEAKEAFKAAPTNYLIGSLAGLGGAVIGSLAFILVAVGLGVLSGWIAFLIAFLTGLFYELAKGKPTTYRMVFVSIVTIVFSVLSLFSSYLIMISTEMSKVGISGDIMQMFKYLMETDVKTTFISDLVVTVIFAGVGILFYYLKCKGKIGKKYK